MSPSTADTPPAATGPEEPDPLIRQLREELIKTQMIVLELNDRILEKETDRADAIAILGRVELVLEQKIAYIVELDAALNARLAALQSDLAAAHSLAAQRAAETARICEERDREYAARDAIIRDLVARLDTANREIGRTHELAGGFARDLAQTRDALAAESAAHQRSRDELAATQTHLAATAQSLADTEHRLADTSDVLAQTRVTLADTSGELTATGEKLHATEAALAAERRTVATIRSSALWRLGRPWRALFGPPA